jgi:hypothetical protein
MERLPLTLHDDPKQKSSRLKGYGQPMDDRTAAGTGDGASASLVAWAEARSRELLGGLGNRWLHVQGVVRKARDVSPVFSETDGDHLVAAACLHDIGYAPELQATGAHQIDGAVYVRSFGHERLAGLVAHHSAARYELEMRGLGPELLTFPSEQSDVTAALTYCDLTTGPTGVPMALEDRLFEVVRRYGLGSLVAQALLKARPELMEAVQRTSQRLRRERDIT